MRLTLTCVAEDESINSKKRSWNNGTPLTKQLRYNKLRLFVGISSKRKKKWSTFGKHKKAVSLLLPYFWVISGKHLKGFFSSCLVEIYWFQWKLSIIRHASLGMLKFDCLKIAEHVFAKSLAVADFVMADAPVSWTFLKQNCCCKFMYMGNQLIIIEFHRRRKT